jgi:2,3-bisphosphoglycerate-dependent phosphoglycerate mutase
LDVIHTLILLRHGESQWNLENRFTGWTDIGLTGQGEIEARSAGELMASEGLQPDVLHTSVLTRAIETAAIALEGAGWDHLPTQRTWRLNEKHYGALQGLNKKETADRHSAERVLLWRRSFDISPPAVELNDPRHPIHDVRYSEVDRSDLPSTECLADVFERMIPYWNEVIAPELRSGLTPLLVAHGNSLRALVMDLDEISESDVVSLNIPTGIPLVYELDTYLRPISSRYLGDAEAAQAAADEVSKQAG